jgi:hypothetical protein
MLNIGSLSSYLAVLSKNVQKDKMTIIIISSLLLAGLDIGHCTKLPIRSSIPTNVKYETSRTSTLS